MVWKIGFRISSSTDEASTSNSGEVVPSFTRNVISYPYGRQFIRMYHVDLGP